MRKFPYTTSEVLLRVEGQSPAGRTNGTYLAMKDGDWYQVTLYKPVGDRVYGYVRSDVVKLIEPQTSPDNVDGEGLVKDLIKQDYLIYHSLLRSAEMLRRLKVKGKDVSKPEAVVNTLAKNLAERKKAIEQSNLVKVGHKIESSHKWILSKLGLSGLGEPVTISLSAAALIFVAGAAAAGLIYFAFKAAKSDSDREAKISKEVEEILTRELGVDGYATFKADMDKQVKDAYADGKSDGEWDGIFAIAKPLLIAAGGFWAVTKFMDYQEDKKLKRQIKRIAA